MIGLAGPATAQNGHDRNIIFVLTDDVGYGDIEKEAELLPALTEFWQGSARFHRAYATDRTCSPSRFGIYTGMTPSRHGWTFNPTHRENLDPEFVTFAEILRENGYTNWFVGKWHLGNEVTPLDQGFDYFFGFLAGSHDYWNSGEKGRMSRRGKLFENNDRVVPDQQLTQAFFAKGAEIVEQWKPQERHFLALSISAAHGPLQPSLEALELLPKDIPEPRRHYLGHLIDIDRGMRQLMDALRRTGRISDTVVIFTNDNGGLSKDTTHNLSDGPGEKLRRLQGVLTDNDGLRQGKGSLYDGGVRVPMAIFGAGIKGSEIDTFVSHLDLFPTILDIADVMAAATTEGRSILPCLMGQECTDFGRAYFLMPLDPEISGYRDWEGDAAMIEPPYKLFLRRRKGVDAVALYDLVKDPGETLDLAGQDPALAEEMADRLRRFLREDVQWRFRATGRFRQ